MRLFVQQAPSDELAVNEVGGLERRSTPRNPVTAASDVPRMLACRSLAASPPNDVVSAVFSVLLEITATMQPNQTRRRGSSLSQCKQCKIRVCPASPVVLSSWANC